MATPSPSPEGKKPSLDAYPHRRYDYNRMPSYSRVNLYSFSHFPDTGATYLPPQVLSYKFVSSFRVFSGDRLLLEQLSTDSIPTVLLSTHL